MNLNRSFLVVLLSAGWLLPGSLSVVLFEKYLHFTLIPQITGKGFIGSYSAGGSCSCCFWLSVVWLGCAIVFWTLRAQRRQGES